MCEYVFVGKSGEITYESEKRRDERESFDIDE